MNESLHSSFRLLPSERLLWHGRPRLGVAREGVWAVVPALAWLLASVVALFAGLLHVAGVPAVFATASLAAYLALTALSFQLAPRYLLDTCQFVVTDRHVIWKRAQHRRVLERRAITYARITWHPSEPGVGTLELVRAAPFGPLARRQSLVLHDIEAPDRVLACIRDQEPAEFAGYGDVQLTDPLDKGERVLWGASPLGLRMGSAGLLTAALGALVTFAGLAYAWRTGAILLALEHVGLPVRSWTWVMFFLAILLSGALIVGVGALLLWKGSLGARAEGGRTEYILTDSRVLIPRGRIELSVERGRIVDVAEERSQGDLGNLYLILDGPHARAPDASGALSLLPRPRATVPPVLFEVRDIEEFRRLLFAKERPRTRPLYDAA